MRFELHHMLFLITSGSNNKIMGLDRIGRRICALVAGEPVGGLPSRPFFEHICIALKEEETG
jgi:hypothetical protein